MESSEQGWPLSIVDGRAADFALIRDACARVSFSEPGVCARFGISRIVDFKSRREGRVQGARVGDALEVLTDLFLDLEAVSTNHAAGLLGRDVVDALINVGLVSIVQDCDDQLYATMHLYPTAGVLITSDRTFGRPDWPRNLPADVVYPSVTRNAHTFVRMLLPSSCDAFLELCAGSGIAAVAMASRAKHSWSLDITERATRVAHFNAQLNGLDNVSALRGDLYEPVHGLTFDRIAAHPPYVAAAEQEIIYRDGGPDGERISRRIVAGLAEHLRPGGRFSCTCMGTDRTDSTFEQRLREWLGDARDEFDIVVAVTVSEHPSEVQFKLAIHGETSFANALQRHEAYKAMQVEMLVFCSFVIERHVMLRAPVTVRLRRSAFTRGREMEHFCDWLARRESPDLNQRLLAAYPKIDREAKLRHVQKLAGEKWKETETEFECAWPFAVTLTCPSDVAQLLARCDGTRTVKQIIAWLRMKGLLPAGVSDQAVLQTFAACVAAGAVDLADTKA